MTMEELMAENLRIQAELKEANNTIVANTTTIGELTTTVDTHKETITNLRESNMSLFLKVSQEVQPTREPEKVEQKPTTEPKEWCDFMGDF